MGLSLASQVTLDQLDTLSDGELASLAYDWDFWARPEQLEPRGTWDTWLVMAGRGFGKTRLGSEWVRTQVCGRTPLSPGRCSRIALVAETAADARDVLVEGDSGILSVHHPDFRPTYNKSSRQLMWPNGATALLFSGIEPEQLRGPQFDSGWVDELGKYQYPQDMWDMLAFGLRLGDKPRCLVTTTPRPIPLIRDLVKRSVQYGGDGSVYLTRGSTFDNADNLASTFIDSVRRRYEGTRLGRQELYAEVLDDAPGALWTSLSFEPRSDFNPVGAGMRLEDPVPEYYRVVVGVDPSGASGNEDSADPIGIVAAAKGSDGLYYVFQDETVLAGPAAWARAAVNCYRSAKADLIVGEKNYGGAMVEHTVRMVDHEVNFKAVDATRGKTIRAEPIAALYEQGRVRHVGRLAALEDEMKNFTRSGYVGSRSPNRADAAIWALTELALGDAEYDREMWSKLAD